MTKRVKIKPLYVHSINDLYMFPREYKTAISRVIKMYPTQYAEFTPNEISCFTDVLRAVYVALDCGDMPGYCDHYLYECRLYSDVATRDLGAYFRQNDRKRFNDFCDRVTGDLLSLFNYDYIPYMSATQYNQQTENLLQHLRGEAQKEYLYQGARATLQGLADYILKYHGDDMELLELAGVPEFPDEDDPREVAVYLDQLTA